MYYQFRNIFNIFIQNFLGIITELTEKTEENVGLQVIIFIIQSYIKKDGFS